VREIAHQNVYSAYFLFLRGGGFVQSSTAKAHEPIFTYVKRRGSTEGCAFSGLENQKLTFTVTPRISRKTSSVGPA